MSGACLEGAVDMFLKIDGIDGEVTSPGHEDEIQVLSWSWSMSNSSTLGGGGSAGAVAFEDIVITKELDKATPLLMQKCAAGQPISNVELYVTPASAPMENFYIISIPDALVTSVKTGGASGDIVLTEEITLNFAEVEVTYDMPGEPPVVFYWNLGVPPE
jgi:type VI secretion system secreted protein Hcp